MRARRCDDGERLMRFKAIREEEGRVKLDIDECGEESWTVRETEPAYGLRDEPSA